MIRAGLAGIVGFVLVFIEVFIVMKLKGYYSIEIGGLAPFITIWTMNFFLLFTMFTHFTYWYDNLERDGQSPYNEKL